MELLPIGAFARASRLSPKALRLYDELGLLRPAHVDPGSGYRYYDPGQLERARLVAWLRRIGMPLTRIRAVCELPPAAAADEVAAFWGRVEADTAARRGLAAFLIDHLRERGTAMPEGTPTPDTTPTLGIRYATRCDRGLVRENNEDAAYAGVRLFAVADGLGGHEAGELASAAAIEAVKPLDRELPAGDLLSALQDAVRRAESALRDLADSDPALAGLGTTLTAMHWSGSRLALVHIGDSRAYVLRDGELFQVTHDHSVVQSLIDEGRLTPEEARSHPQRAILLRALTGKAPVEADVSLRDARAGDRYLLCSDGLSAVVSAESLHAALAAGADPEETVRRLVDLAYEGGGPDNVTCIVADVVEIFPGEDQ